MNNEGIRIKKLLNNEVTKRNIINQMRDNDFTAPELKIFSVYLSKIDTREGAEAPHSRKVRFTFEDFQKLTGLKRLRYSDIKPHIDSLLEKKLHFPNDHNGVTAFQIFKKIETGEENGVKYIDIDAHDDALPYLFNIKSSYMHYKLWNILRLTSSNQVRMYEILKQWIDVKKDTHTQHEFEIEELRGLLGLPINKYTRFQNFKERILDSCADALKENTDIYFTYQTGRTGKYNKCESIIFDIFKNTNGEITAFEKLFAELADSSREDPAEPLRSDRESAADPAGNSHTLEAGAASQLTGQAQTFTPSEQTTAGPREDSAAPIRLGDTAFSMYCVADDTLTERDILEIKAAMEEKGYKNTFLSFKRLYFTAQNNCKDRTKIKGYILKNIENDTKGLETA